MKSMWIRKRACYHAISQTKLNIQRTQKAVSFKTGGLFEYSKLFKLFDRILEILRNPPDAFFSESRNFLPTCSVGKSGAGEQVLLGVVSERNNSFALKICNAFMQ